MNIEKYNLQILHILDHSLPLHSGYTFRSNNILQSQLKMGLHAVALTSERHNRGIKKAVPRDERFEGIQYYRCSHHNGMHLPIADLYNMLMLERRCREICTLEKPDLIHAHSPVLNCLPTLRSGKSLKIPVVYEIRAFWEDAGVDHGTYQANSMKYRIVRSLDTWACRKASQVVVICDGLKKDLEKRGIDPQKITIIANGIDTNEFQPCTPDEQAGKIWDTRGKRIIGFMGSFYHYEGLDLLIDAFAQICIKRSDILLLLAGGGQEEEKLKAQARKLGIEGKIIFPGRIAHKRIPGLYALTDILAYPRYSMRLTELVTPLKPLEAMAMSKPLVASNIGGHRELIQDRKTGLLFEPGNKEALASALEQILDNPEFGKTLGRQGRDWVCRERTWEKVTAPYEQVYEKAIQSMKFPPKRLSN